MYTVYNYMSILYITFVWKQNIVFKINIKICSGVLSYYVISGLCLFLIKMYTPNIVESYILKLFEIYVHKSKYLHILKSPTDSKYYEVIIRLNNIKTKCQQISFYFL